MNTELYFQKFSNFTEKNYKANRQNDLRVNIDEYYIHFFKFSVKLRKKRVKVTNRMDYKFRVNIDNY